MQQNAHNEKLLEFIKCKENFSYFCKKYVKILNPEQGLVNFKLYPFQENKVFPTFERENYVILKKFRQAGLSTIAAIYSLWKILFNTDQRILMISITDRDAKNLMSMIKRTWEYLPEWMKCQTTEDSQHVLKLETSSEIRCGTPKMGRGYSANLIVIDEAAFVVNMEEVWKSIYPTLSAAGENGKAFIISTVNGLGNWYANTYHDAKDGKNNFYCLDLSYKEHPNYNNPVYVENMKTQLGEKGFEQEVLGHFLSGSDTFIKPKIIQKLLGEINKNPEPVKKTYNNKLWIWKEPSKKRSYILCADTAEGHGGNHDYSAFHVLDLITLEQVCEFCDNTISTYKYSEIINEVGRYYNDAIVVCENNGLGLAVLEKLYYELDYENVHWTRNTKRGLKIGFSMNSKTRPLVLNSFSNILEQGYVKLNSPRLLHEIQTFEYNRNTGKAEARRGRHDDLIMSMAVGLFIRNNVINELPLGAEKEYDLESEEFQPTFVKSGDQIIDIQKENDYPQIYVEGSHEVDFSIMDDGWEDSEEALLREFGW